jgi:hypothetical protein
MLALKMIFLAHPVLAMVGTLVKQLRTGPVRTRAVVGVLAEAGIVSLAEIRT